MMPAAARASLVSTIEPVWTIALAGLLLVESLGPIQLLGGAIILGESCSRRRAPERVGGRQSSESRTNRSKI